MVYDGSSLKYYRNGYLLSEIACSGNMITNSYATTFGTTACTSNPWPSEFLGLIDEVRIWNVARTQDQLKTYMDKSLPNPSAQTGLKAYYTFDDLKNEQGNNTWNGGLLNSASIKDSNPTCQNFIADSCGITLIPDPIVIAGFVAPDTVCINTPVTIQNTTTGGTNFYWNFCETAINQIPDGINLGNIGNQLNLPVFMDFAEVNGNYYGFVVNNYPGQLVRLDFGNSLLNAPTAVNLGNFGGLLQNNAEGVQLIKDGNSWYAFIVGGYIGGGTIPFILKVDFGSNITNGSPIVINWGNVGNLAYPHDIYIFNENGNWYGFTPNAENKTLTRFNFGTDFTTSPTAINLGNLGDLDWSSGIHVIKNNSKWYIFIANRDNNTLTRLDFGTSLLNTPVAINLGNLNGLLNEPRDIQIVQSCDGIFGYVLNEQSNNIIKLNFGFDIESTPSSIILNNITGLSFPNSFSKFFRIGSDLYSFIPNVNSNTLVRLQFSGCNNSSIPNSSDSIPQQITYNAPGIYNINLMVDEGLATQTSLCKSIVVMPSPVKTPLFDTAFCSGDSLLLKTSFPEGTYTWNNGKTDSVITVNQPGIYWVQSDYYGCTVRDSINTLQNISPIVNLGPDTTICRLGSLLLNAGNNGSTYLWNDGRTTQTIIADTAGIYIVHVTNTSGCAGSDSLKLSAHTAIQLKVTNDTTICTGSNISLTANGNNVQAYAWSPGNTLSDPSVKNPLASPIDTTQYYIVVTDIYGCKESDSVLLNVAPMPVVTVLADTAICAGGSVLLSTNATQGVSYLWSPSGGLSSNTSATPLATPSNGTKYIVTVTTDAGCKALDSVAVVVNPLPAVVAGSLDSLICFGNSTTIAATSPTAVSYIWSPVSGLNDPSLASPVATPNATTNYIVEAADIKGCKAKDSVQVAKAITCICN
nr:LamG domain-containing protein [Panacibacter ginsenosidivorans]